MKKCAFALLFTLLAQNLSAQEAIPLFADSSFEPTQTVTQKQLSAQKTVVPTNKGVSNPSGNVVKQTTQTKRRRLGREAEPLTKLVIAPFPNTTIEIDSRASMTQEKTHNKKFTEQNISETELIKREAPVTMTESADERTKQIMGEKIRAGALNRHDVSKFKVAGLRLGMDTETVYEEMAELGYTLARVEKSIPLFRTSHYDTICRQKHNLTILSDIRQCVLNYAEQDEVHYVFRETYERPQSNETVQVSYSTPDTMNVAYKIVYKSKGDNSLGTSRPSLAKKQQRHEEFWNMVFDAYGLPDENDTILWGNPNTVYMRALMRGTAQDAYVFMEDRLIQDKDYEAAQTAFKTLRKPSTFTLTGVVEEETEE